MVYLQLTVGKSTLVAKRREGFYYLFDMVNSQVMVI